MRRILNDTQISRGAMIVAILALCVATAGGAFAAATLKKNSVKTKFLKNGAVTESKLANGAVTSTKLGAGAVSSKVSIIRQTGQTITVPNTESRAGTITCPSGYQAIAGATALVGPSDADDNAGDDTGPVADA